MCESALELELQTVVTTQCGCWKSNSNPLKDKKVLTTRSSFSNSPLDLYFISVVIGRTYLFQDKPPTKYSFSANY